MYNHGEAVHNNLKSIENNEMKSRLTNIKYTKKRKINQTELDADKKVLSTKSNDDKVRLNELVRLTDEDINVIEKRKAEFNNAHYSHSVHNHKSDLTQFKLLNLDIYDTLWYPNGDDGDNNFSSYNNWELIVFQKAFGKIDIEDINKSKKAEKGNTIATIKQFLKFKKHVPEFLATYKEHLSIDKTVKEAMNQNKTKMEIIANKKNPSVTNMHLNCLDADVKYQKGFLIGNQHEEPEKICFEPISSILDNIIVNREETDIELKNKKLYDVLPIHKYENEIINTIKNNSIVILVGATGSGKTTQLGKICLKAGLGGYKNKFKHSKYKYSLIGCTQPRRIATISIANRVAEELNSDIGKTVGYSIRFEDCTSHETKIRFMTDTYLLRDLLSDPLLLNYSTVIIDEVHERSLSGDLLLSLVKSICKKRSDFRLILSSATLNIEKFVSYFIKPYIFKLPGITYPVTVMYSLSTAEDYILSCAMELLNCHITCPFSLTEESDILVFLTGKEEINTFCYVLHNLIQSYITKKHKYFFPLIVLPIYGSLPAEFQKYIFDKMRYRKCIIATNIAETSLTISGIKYVIDCGYCKLKKFNQRFGLESLTLSTISKANAEQRSGRAGRTCPGFCYRVYTQQDYLLFRDYPIPEIYRSNIAFVCLLLKSFNVNDIASYEMVDMPTISTIVSALNDLYTMNALNNKGYITQCGKLMLKLPLELNLSRLIVAGIQYGCSHDTLIIASMLSVCNQLFIYIDNLESYKVGIQKFLVNDSDHLTLLNMFNVWKENSYSKLWCEKYKFNYRAMLKALDIQNQLNRILLKNNLPIDNRSNVTKSPFLHHKLIRKAICLAFIDSVSRLNGNYNYFCLAKSILGKLHSRTSIFLTGRISEYIVYSQIILLGTNYITHATEVSPSWVVEIAPEIYTIYETTIDNATIIA